MSIRTIRSAGRPEWRSGSSFIDLIVAMGILALLFAGVYLVYFSIVDATVNIELRSAATAALNRQVEIVRNLPYDQVGVVGGIPAGVIPQSQEVSAGNRTFVLSATVRNIDDDFDSTADGAPADTAPADYKLVALEISCPGCVHFVPLNFTTTVAPKNLESESSAGSLFVNVFDALGAPVPGAEVRVANSSVSPGIDFTDVTGADGVLQLVGVPTSTQAYSVEVSKDGYSSDHTYPLGAPGNPNPVKPHATVAAQTVTNVSFVVDRVSRLAVHVSGPTCLPYEGQDFLISGSKLVGVSPDVLKFSAAEATGADGAFVFEGLEWDAYDIAHSEPGFDFMGATAFLPLVVDPDTEREFRFVVQPADPSALLVTVTDGATGEGISGASVALTGPGSPGTKITGRHTLHFSDWSDSNYAAQSGGVDAEGDPGSLRLLANASGTYPNAEWLESNTIDLGGQASSLYGFSWTGDEPSATDIDLELAANNDDSTWNFVDLDGSTPDPSLDGNRYVRYRVRLSTGDPLATPRLDSAALEFSSVCVPPYHAFWSGLAAGSYDLQVSAPGYDPVSAPVTVGEDWQEIEISL